MQHEINTYCTFQKINNRISMQNFGVGSQVRKNKIKLLSSNKILEIQHKKYLHCIILCNLIG